MQRGWRARLTPDLANQRSSAGGVLCVFRSSLFLLRLTRNPLALCFKFSALAAPLRRSCPALILAALSAAVAGAQSAGDLTITTVAGGGSSLGDGGAATTAQLNNPRGLAVDGAGNLYIADTWNNRIRKVDTAGVITTVAGTGTKASAGTAARPRRRD